MKKILSLGIAVAMVMALAGCGDTAPDPGSTGKSKPITLEDYENIAVGMTADEVGKKFGEPEFTTSGVWVETYYYSDQAIAIMMKQKKKILVLC